MSEQNLTEAVAAIRALLAVPAGSGDAAYGRPYERATRAVTVAEQKQEAAHVLIANRLREMTGLQVAKLITDPELRTRALARELRRAEAYQREIQDTVGALVLEHAEDRGMKFKIFEWLGAVSGGSRTSRVTLDRWAERVKVSRSPGGLPTWLQPEVDDQGGD